MSELLQPDLEKIAAIESLVGSRPEVVGLQTYEYFRNNAQAQKVAFISGEIECLELAYPELEADTIHELGNSALDIMRGLMVLPVTEKVNSLYNAIEYRYTEMFLLSVAEQLRREDMSIEQRKELQQWFISTSEALYGVPEKAVFDTIAKDELSPHLRRDFDIDTQAAARAIQQELLGLVGQIDPLAHDLYVADSDKVLRLRGILEKKIGHIAAHIDTEKTYDIPEMVDALNIALQQADGEDTQWRAEVVQNSSNLATSAHRKLIEVGEHRKLPNGLDFKGLVYHEVGVHALRSMNALKAGWLSAAYGQHGYLDFEEGVANAFEDANKGAYKTKGTNYYLIAGLAYGFDNHEPRDFRETYEVMWRTQALRTVKGNSDLTVEAIAKAKDGAFTSCLRLFRGTDTKTKGMIYLKDLSYFRGQELAWSVLGNVEKPEDLDLVLAGKLDLTRPDHRRIGENIVASLSHTQ